VTVVTQASDESGGVYSSSRIRQLLGEGKPREAAALLGRPWEIEGRVEHGDKRGRTLDFPTANVMLGDYLRPAYGVYAVRAAVDEGRDAPVWRDGVANLGIRPMWQTDEPVLETFLFDFSGDLYGRHLRVQLVDFLRGEQRFDGVDALVAQMRRDTDAARAALAAEG
jgi:riboflavin kinase/FMN adenylyltransferase